MERIIYGCCDVVFDGLALKKAPVNPSGPGVLSDGIEFIVSLISSCVNGTSSSERSRGVYHRDYQSKVLALWDDVPK